MKKVFSTLVIILLAAPAFAHNCSFNWDGENYNLGFTDSSQPLTVGETDKNMVQYQQIDSQGQVTTQNAFASYQIQKLVVVDQNHGQCPNRPAGAPKGSAIDTKIIATQISVTANGPVFSSPTDGPNPAAVTMWGICTEQLYRNCL